MRDLGELNMNEGGRPVRRSPPTDFQISEFEVHFAVKLPGDYLTFLRQSNGGNPELGAYQPKGLVQPVLCGVDRFYFLSDDHQDLEGVWQATREWRTALGKNIVAIGSDGGGNQIL